MKTFLAAATFLVALSANAAADSCSEPSAPGCASENSAFDDEDDFDSCKREIENYRDEVETYRRCLAREEQRALDDLNRAIDSFNRRVGGG